MSDQTNEPKVRREKPDAADAVDATETFVPGEIPVSEAETAQWEEARATEQQPDPAEAARAVNPEYLADEVSTTKDRKTGD